MFTWTVVSSPTRSPAALRENDIVIETGKGSMGNSNTLSNRGPIGSKLVIGISRNIAVDSRKGVL